MPQSTISNGNGSSQPGAALLATLLQHVRDTRAAYYRGVPGVTYETMADAAYRYLRMRAIVEGKTGRAAVPTKGAIAHLLRAL